MFGSCNHSDIHHVPRKQKLLHYISMDIEVYVSVTICHLNQVKRCVIWTIFTLDWFDILWSHKLQLTWFLDMKMSLVFKKMWYFAGYAYVSQLEHNTCSITVVIFDQFLFLICNLLEKCTFVDYWICNILSNIMILLNHASLV